MLDIFRDDAFGVVPLTDAINKLKFVPGRLGQLGIFNASGVNTTTVAIEERDGILKLIAPTPRGGPGVTLDKSKRKLRAIAVPHFEVNDAVMAEEVQGVRAWGEESAVETVMGKVAERGQEISQSFAATEEYARIGAVKGVITYADGSTLNLFTEFGVSQVAEVNLDFDVNSGGALRKLIQDSVVRQMAKQLQGVPFSGVLCLCGDTFFDDLIANDEVRAAYLQQQEASQLREGYVSSGQIYGSFDFGGVRWENYRGEVDGTAFVDATKGHFIPLGVPGLFRTYYAPADYIETVNTLGQRLYAKLYEMPNGKGMHYDVQNNGLHICTRPNALIQGRNT